MSKTFEIGDRVKVVKDVDAIWSGQDMTGYEGVIVSTDDHRPGKTYAVVLDGVPMADFGAAPEEIELVATDDIEWDKILRATEPVAVTEFGLGDEVLVTKLDLSRNLAFGYELGDIGTIVAGSRPAEDGKVWVNVERKQTPGEGVAFSPEELLRTDDPEARGMVAGSLLAGLFLSLGNAVV